MSTPSRVQSNPAAPSGYAQLVAGSSLLKRAADGGFVTRAVGGGALKRWIIRIVLAVIVLYALWRLFLVAVSIMTTDMWFNSVHAGREYTTTIVARILLFTVFAAVAGVVGGLTTLVVRRIRPLPLSSENDTFRWTFRKYEPRVSRLVVLLGVLVPAILVGLQAQAGWQTYLLWRNTTPFHTADPLFHKDLSFYTEVYPFHQLVVTLLLQAVGYALWIAVVAGYWYGAWRLRRGPRKVTRGLTQLFSVLVAGYLVLTAYNFWLSRYGLTTSPRGPVTGAGYTDIHASLPGIYAEMAVALLCAAVLVANAIRVRRFRVLAATVVVMVVAAQVIGSAVPGLVYHYREAPSAAKVDLSEIANNQKATRAAFGLDGDVTTVGFGATNTSGTATPEQLARTTAQASVIDPNQLSPTFNVKQQLQAYYSFKSTLDISHYDIGGRSQDVAIAARELGGSGIPQPSWVNLHLVYTHGYGIVAAPTTEMDPVTESPVFLDGGMPPAQQIPVTRPQIYFGQGFGSSSYSIVGQPAGSKVKLELDHPASDRSSKSAHTTYHGHGGIPLGSLPRRLLFAVQLRSPNVLFSSELNSASQLLTVLDPRARVAKVAPWLTLDGDVYPAVVGGEIKWIVDGYTTSSNYPDSQLVNLQSATTTTLTANGASVIQPSTQVNYMHNSVKAVVDAYTGRVSLYEWQQQKQPDPLLKSWESAFPGLVKPQSSIPSALLSQLRYPTDLFNVQRTLLAKYHVGQPEDFYSGSDFWTVPADATVSSPINSRTSTASAASGPSTGPSATSSRTSAATATPAPSRYMSLSPTGYGSPQYTLSSPMVTLNGRDLAAFVSVNSEPGPDYGKFTVLEFPAGSGSESPSQVQNDIESDTTITEALTLQRGGNSSVVLGDLESIPVAGRILYVEPVYTQSNGGTSFPILRHVIALYGNGRPSFENTLDQAIKDAVTSAAVSG